MAGEEKLAFITGELVNETILRYGDWGVLTTREYLGTLPKGTVHHYRRTC